MSNPNEPSDTTKPVVKDKNPHNYRKVGYSMIVISISLVLIGLLVWAIGDNYHFSSDIMANQEIDAMTPKHGYNIVLYDTAQPVGAKLKLLDSASTVDASQQKLSEYAKQLNTDKETVLIFNETLAANQKQVSDTIDAISKVQATIAQAIKDQEAKAQAAQSQNTQQTISAPVASTPPTPNASSSNLTKTVTPTPQVAIPINSTGITPTSTVQLSNKSSGNNLENMGIGANVTVAKSNSTSHVQNVTLSESVGLKTQ